MTSNIHQKHNRRSFLKITTVAGGGLMLGMSVLASCKRTGATAEAELDMPEEWYEMNAFLKVGDNGVVTIYSPNPEIGQNVKTAMPMIVAEELDVDWKNVVVEQAGLDTEKYTRQVAGGSQSIRLGWNSLRKAGATARRMLMEAAAQQWEVPVEELTTEAGVIKHDKSGQTIGYGEVANAAGQLDVPEEVELKDPKDFKIIGTPTRNVDRKEIVTGQPLFGLDVQREGMLIAMAEHPPAFGMTVKSFDATEALSMPGIKEVFTIDTKPEGADMQWSDVSAFPQLVVIVGESTWQVMKAKKTLKIEWEKTSDLENTETQEAKLARLIDTPADQPTRKDGNPEKAFADAAQIIERTYSAPFLAHNPMEPMNFFAHVTDEKAELVGPIQTPQYLEMTVSELLDMPKEQISIMMTRQGGGFGRRLYGHFGTEAALISQKMKAPVKLVYSREDDMTNGVYRPAYKVKYRAALDENKNLIGFHIRGAGVHGSPVFANRFPAGTIDNYLVENHNLDSNVSTGAWRAPRSNFIAGAEQSFLDEVAEAMGKDPIDLRLELFERAINNPVGEDNDYDAERYAGVLKLVREKSGWGQNDGDRARGVSAYFCHNSYVAQVVDIVQENDRPRVDKVWCAVDCGIVVNPEGARNQIEGGLIDGIGHAMFSALTLKDGQPQQKNFDTYRMIRHTEAPRDIETHFVDNGIDPTGLGEPGLPPIMAAVANALYKATGKRLYKQPFVAEQDLLG